ncbi:MAG: metal-dependent transcriptional regulator [Nitrospinota bacterium]
MSAKGKMMAAKLGQHMEDYLKTIYKLQEESSPVTTKAIAKRMGVSAASVTSMMKKLAEMGLLQYTRYRGVILTGKGERVALEVIRHHRLLELYLTQEMGMGWHEVDAEAEALEHVISEEFEEVMDRALGRPTRDPHGEPIPGRDGSMVAGERESLCDLEPGERGTVRRVQADDPAFLRYMASLGIYPEVEVAVMEKAPFRGPLTVEVAGDRRVLGREAAEKVFVTR